MTQMMPMKVDTAGVMMYMDRVLEQAPDTYVERMHQVFPDMEDHVIQGLYNGQLTWRETADNIEVIVR